MSSLTISAVREMLATDLNRICRSPGLYELERFAAVHLSAKTQELLKANSGGENSVRLNRLLLMDAYPQELERGHARECTAVLRSGVRTEWTAE